MAQINHPRHPSQLESSKWTSTESRIGFRHFEVDSVDTKTGTAVLRPTLDRSQVLEIPWRELRDRQVWLPGWQGDLN